MTSAKAALESLAIGTEKRIAVVLEIGSAYTRCGFAGESCPRHIVATKVRRYMTDKIVSVFSDEFLKNPTDLYDVLIDFIEFIYFKCLLVNPKDRRVVIVEPLVWPDIVRQTLARVLFEHYYVPSLLFYPSPFAALLPLGVSTALVVDCGYAETSVLPVYEGYGIIKGWDAIRLAGKTLHGEIEHFLREHATVTDGQDEKRYGGVSEDVLEDIKARTCFLGDTLISSQYQALSDVLGDSESRAEEKPKRLVPPNVDYPLDGISTLVIPGILRDQAPEVLFKPNDDGEGESIVTTILDSIRKCPMDTRRALSNNIVVVGGTAMLPGFLARLQLELSDVAKNEKYSKLLPGADFLFHELSVPANVACWVGGAILASLDSLPENSLSRARFLETNRLPDWTSCDPEARQVRPEKISLATALRRLSATPKPRKTSGGRRASASDAVGASTPASSRLRTVSPVSEDKNES
ncbi:actin-related protein 10-like [Oscarella lobularis]|uniref:actin-related protein 10-like n=1 Tax=Oscarella lobularis TaxID=121494 RepID=UPI0033131A6F